jgi:hypothetical protein
MSALIKLASAVLVSLAIAGCASTESGTGRPCERCSRGYLPVDSPRDERRAVCVVKDDVVNCDKIPAGCSECAKIQKRDLDAR